MPPLDDTPHAELDKGPLLKLQDEGLLREKDALEAVLALLLSEAQAAFRNQGWRGGTAWGPRMTPNVPGIVRDLEAGSTALKKRRTQPQPALVDTGRLRQSFDGRVDTEEGSVTIGTNVKYARKLHDGGSETIRGAAKGSPIRRNLFMLLKRNPKLKPELGWLFGVEQFTVKIRARSLVEATSAIISDAKELFKEFRQFPGGES